MRRYSEELPWFSSWTKYKKCAGIVIAKHRHFQRNEDLNRDRCCCGIVAVRVGSRCCTRLRSMRWLELFGRDQYVLDLQSHCIEVTANFIQLVLQEVVVCTLMHITHNVCRQRVQRQVPLLQQFHPPQSPPRKQHPPPPPPQQQHRPALSRLLGPHLLSMVLSSLSLG